MTVAASAGSTTNEIRKASMRDQSLDMPIRRSSAARASASDHTVRCLKRTRDSALRDRCVA